jgi:hypothetical protein
MDVDDFKKIAQDIVVEAMHFYKEMWVGWLRVPNATIQEKELARMKINLIIAILKGPKK